MNAMQGKAEIGCKSILAFPCMRNDQRPRTASYYEPGLGAKGEGGDILQPISNIAPNSSNYEGDSFLKHLDE